MPTRQLFSDYELTVGGSGSGGNIYIQNGLDFTNQVQYTGARWFGKKIYRLTQPMGALPNTNTNTKAHGIAGIAKIIKVEGVGNGIDGVTIPIPYAQGVVSPPNIVSCYASFTSVNIQASANLATAYPESYVTIYFTYTVEPADPPNPFTQSLVPQMDMIRDLSKSEVIKSGTAWPAFTVTKAGYYVFRPVTSTPAAGSLGFNMRVNGGNAPIGYEVMSSAVEAYALGLSDWTYCEVGDVLTFEINGVPEATSTLYYSPPKWIKSGFDADLVTVPEIAKEVKDLLGVSNWVIEHKTDAPNGQWNYRKWASGYWEGWIDALSYSGPLIAANSYAAVTITTPARPAGVTVTRCRPVAVMQGASTYLSTYSASPGAAFVSLGFMNFSAIGVTPTGTVDITAKGTWS